MGASRARAVSAQLIARAPLTLPQFRAPRCRTPRIPASFVYELSAMAGTPRAQAAPAFAMFGTAGGRPAHPDARAWRELFAQLAKAEPGETVKDAANIAGQLRGERAVRARYGAAPASGRPCQ